MEKLIIHHFNPQPAKNNVETIESTAVAERERNIGKSPCPSKCLSLFDEDLKINI